MRIGAQALLPFFFACFAFVIIASLWPGSDSVDYGSSAAKRSARSRAGRAEDAPDADGENQVQLRGQLADAESGEPVSAQVTVFGAHGPEQSAQAGVDGVFQIRCGHPGRATIAVPRTEGHFGLFQEIDLAEHMPLQRLGLQPRRDLPVLLRTPDGKPLSQVAPPPAAWVRETWPRILITPLPPVSRAGEGAPDPLLATRLGRFLSVVGGEEPRRPGSIDCCVGYVRLYQAPPVSCSLMIGSRVLQTLQLAGREKLISFIVDPAELERTHAELELRLVDADTGLPPEPRRGLWLGTIGGRPTELDAALDEDGRVVIPDVPAGSLELHLRLSGYEQLTQRVDLQPGEHNDIGLLRVPPGACVAGHIVSESGAPVSARVWSSTREGYEHPVGQASETPEAADWFAICGLPRAKVLVGIDDPRWAQNPVEVDLASGSVQNERLVARKGTLLRLVGPHSASGTARLRVLDARGLCVWHGENLVEELHELRLLPGPYTIEVRRGSTLATREEVDLEKTPDATILLR
jgi:hypothetical protein